MDYISLDGERQVSSKKLLPAILFGSAFLMAIFYVSSSSSSSSLLVTNTATQQLPSTAIGSIPVARPARVERASIPQVTKPVASVPEAHDEAEVPFGQIASVIGALAAAFGAGLMFARSALTPRPESLALLSSTSEKADESRSLMRQMVENLDSEDMRLISRGASMVDVARSKGIDEVAMAIRADQLSRKDLTPKQVILEMQRGNGRFWMGLSERPDMTAMERRALIMAQAPKICILSCADSRVPVEIIFDQGLGEVFVVRTAGNILDTNAHGSIEYAVKYLGVKVLMVIGHEACGAVKGAISMTPDDLAKEPFDLQVVLQSIRSNLDVNGLNKINDSRSRDREAVVLNTSIQVQRLQQNQLIAQKVADGSLLVCGAFYEISSGIVDLFSLDKNGFLVDL